MKKVCKIGVVDMKFVELKSNIAKGLKLGYVIYGDDAFLIDNSIALIVKALALNMPEINKVVYDETKLSFAEIVKEAQGIPFIDEKRVVIVKDYKPTDVKNDVKLLAEKKEALAHNCFILTTGESAEVAKKFEGVLEAVDCNHLDERMLYNWIVQKVGKSGKQITENGANLLINYCNGDLTRISTETTKLISATDLIDDKVVKNLVVPDPEFEIFELTDALSAKDNKKVFDIINALVAKDKNSVGLVQFLYSTFRRLLLVSLSTEDENTLGAKLGIKPYAVKMARKQAKKFTIKDLKLINTNLSQIDVKIKEGKLPADFSIEYAVCKILLMR